MPAASLRHLTHLVVALLVGATIAAVAVHLRGQATAERQARAAAEQLAAELRLERDSLARIESARADSVARATAAALEQLAAEQRRTADEARRLRLRLPSPDTTARDSLRYWRGAAELAVAETVELRAALATADSLRSVDAVRIRRLTAEAQAAQRAADSTAVAHARTLATLVPTDGDACRIPLLITSVRCPSRAESALAGAALALALTR